MHFGSDGRNVLTVRCYLAQTGVQDKFRRRTGCLAAFNQGDLSIFGSPRLDRSRFILHGPVHMRVANNWLRTQALSIQEQLDILQIRIAPDVYILALFSIPVPVRKEMQDWLGPPPRFVVADR